MMTQMPDTLWRVAATVIGAALVASLGFALRRIGDHSRLMKYFRIMPEIYSFSRFAISTRAAFYDYYEIGALRELIKSKSALMVAGEAGIGKTSLLLHRLEAYCRETTKTNYFWTKIPVIVKTTTLHNCLNKSSHDSLVEMVSVALRTAGVIDYGVRQDELAGRLVKQGRCVFLIDDIDQMDAACTNKLTQILTDTLPRTSSRFILGCRVAYFEQNLREIWQHMGIDDHLDVRQLEAMTQAQVSTFQRVIAEELKRERLNDAATRLRALANNPDVASLCRHPFYMALLLKLIEHQVDIDTDRISPYYLIDIACRHFIDRDSPAVTIDSPRELHACCKSDVASPLIGYLAYNNLIPGTAPGRPLRDAIRSALNAMGTDEYSPYASQLEHLISNVGISTST